MTPLIVACRSLIRRPSFAAAAVVTLALGVGATTAMFSVVDTVLVQPPPFPSADRLVAVMETNPTSRQKTSLIAPGRLEDWNRTNRTFEVLAASAGLLVRSYYNLSPVNAGFRPDHVMTFHVGAAWDENRDRIGEMQEQLVANVQRLPGVRAVGITNFLPATGATLRYQIALDGISTTED